MLSIKCKNISADPKSVLLGLREKSMGLSKAQTRIPWREIIRNIPISNTSIKERIKKAANRQKIAELNEIILKAQESLKQVQIEIEPLPDMTGKKVLHKKYGNGNVLEYENGHIKISFSEKDVTFQYPHAFVNGFLTCDEIDETAFKRNEES